MLLTMLSQLTSNPSLKLIKTKKKEDDSHA
jgi:hypothetical protein